MKPTPSQKRAARKAGSEQQLDMNLVSLIDIFTILIFFLLSSASGVELLTMPKAIAVPEAAADTQPKPASIVVAVDGQEILVEGRRVASVPEVMASPDELIAPLQAELQAQASKLAGAEPVGSAPGSPAAATDTRRRVTIMGDKDIPYSLLRKVMASASSVDFADVSFVVRRKYES